MSKDDSQYSFDASQAPEVEPIVPVKKNKSSFIPVAPTATPEWEEKFKEFGGKQEVIDHYKSLLKNKNQDILMESELDDQGNPSKYYFSFRVHYYGALKEKTTLMAMVDVKAKPIDLKFEYDGKIYNQEDYIRLIRLQDFLF